ncbi:phage protease [Stappia sp.]|uniref:phage protease n=1 Tax=Stappia sp. TaxID=1870903 RepID=UPI003C7A7E3B
MTTRTATALFSTTAIASETGSAAPAWVQLLPAGPELVARDGRRWRLSDPASVIAAFEENGAPLPIDYEHGQAHRAPKGETAPAAGWITAMEVRDGALWGAVEWTDKAAAMIAAREYRFLSPEFLHSKTGEILRLAGAGLVNRPALRMAALSRAEDPASPNPSKDAPSNLPETSMDLTALCRALGLDAGASIDNILAAVERLKTEHQTATAAAQAPDMERFVPRADYDQAIARADTAETALAAEQAKIRDADVNAAIEDAVKGGKIAPASREHYRALCAQEGGLDRFKDLVGTLPVIGKPSDLDDKDPAAGKTALTDQQRSIASKLGLSDEEYAATA